MRKIRIRSGATELAKLLVDAWRASEEDRDVLIGRIRDGKRGTPKSLEKIRYRAAAVSVLMVPERKQGAGDITQPSPGLKT